MAESRKNAPEIDSAIDEAVRAWHQEDAGAVTVHPDPDALVDYQEGRLTGSDAADVREHLVRCADCREELMILEGFDREPADASLGPTEAETERSWQRFREERDAARAAREIRQPQSQEHDPQPIRQSWPIQMAAAAVFTALAFGIFLLGRWADGDRAVEDVARSAPFVFDLEPEGSTVLRGAEGAQEIEVPAMADVLIPRLSVSDLTRYESYWVEIRHDNVLVGTRPGLRQPTGRISFLVPRDAWPEGETTIRLLARRGDADLELATYPVRLRFGT